MDKNLKKIKSILLYILALNWGVALAKIAVGFWLGIISMVADGFHSLTDGASNIIGLVGITAASKPVDSDHPYGHKKIESFTALLIAALLVLVCYEILKEAIKRIATPITPTVNWSAFAVMIVTISINIFVFTYEARKGKQLKSDILISDSLHTRSDVLVSSLVILSLISVKLGLPFLDPVFSLLIIVFIFASALRIIQHIFGILVDKAVLNKQQVKAIVFSHPEVKSCHKIRSRGREDDIKVDLHISVDPGMSVEKSHNLSHMLQEEIKKQLPGVHDVIIHIEPYNIHSA
jgi:cation diffusion facilitator family transporter